MYLQLHKKIETKPSNNLSYEGGLGQSKASKYILYKSENKTNFLSLIKDKS